jgi:hypothetical protein
MNSTGEERPRRRLVSALFSLGLGLFFLFSVLNRPSIANMGFHDLVRLLGTGMMLGIGLSGLVLHFVVRRKG